MSAFLVDGDPAAPIRILLAHGAGAPMTSPFMDALARRLDDQGLGVSRFEFGYMAARRTSGKRAPPPKAERLMDEMMDAAHEAAAHLPAGGRLFIGGKSLGGRVASLVADRLLGDGTAAGLVCFGYPFHPPGQPAKLRTAHLAGLVCPALIVQGERDPFGSREEVEALAAGGALSPAIGIVWATDGDHDLGPRGGSGATRAGNLAAAAAEAARFVREVAARR